jgi:hypothetical protein
MSGNVRLIRNPVAVFLVCLASVFAAVTPGRATEVQLLPPAISDLLPSGTVGVVLAPDFDELAGEVQRIVKAFDAEAATRADLNALVEKGISGFHQHFDSSGSFVLAVALPQGGPATPTFTVIGPAADPKAKVEEILAPMGMAAGQIRNGFLAVSSDPTYAPSAQRSSILDDMPAGDLSVRVDLEQLVQTLGPMLKAVVGMGMAGAAADTTRNFPLGPQQQSDVISVLSDILDSAKTLDLAVDYRGSTLVLHSRFETLEGSTLAPGPQPAIADGIELARLLPPDAKLVSATAMNLDSVLDLYRRSLGIMNGISSQDLPGGFGKLSGDLLNSLFENPEWMSAPNAVSLGFVSGSPELTIVSRLEGVAGRWNDIVGTLQALSDVSPDFSLERKALEVPGGWEAESLHIDLALPDSLKASDGDAAMAMAMLRALIPTVYEAHRDDLGMWMATSHEQDFRDLLVRVDADEWPKPAPELESALQWAGEGTQSVYTMEARGLIDSALDLLRGFMDIPLAKSPPVRVDGAIKIEGNSYSQLLRLNLEDAAALIQELMHVFQSMDSGNQDESKEASVVPSDGAPPGGALSLEEATRLAAKLQPAIETMRGHSFSEDVSVSVIDDAEARKYFDRQLRDELPEGMLESYSTVYADLGMMEKGSSMLGSILNLLEEQAGGFYDPRTRGFYMLDDMPRATAPIIMVHELTHALDDQVFDLESFLDDAKANNDALTARGCVGEGSGMITMTVWVTRAMMKGELDTKAITAFAESQAGQAKVLRSTAPVIANALTAPYLVGQRFLGRGDLLSVTTKVPAADIDHAFEHPPLSMEQVLHPEKYWSTADYDAPREVELPDLTEHFDAGFEAGYRGVLGELDLASLTGWRVDLENPQSLLQGETSTAAARGWDGDQFCLYRNGERSLTALGIVFDSDEDAQEFANAVDLPEGSQISVEADRVAILCGDVEAASPGTSTDLLEEMRVGD